MATPRLAYEDALANLNKGGLTGNTLAMAQDSLKNSYSPVTASPGATSPAPTAITPPSTPPAGQNSQPKVDTSGYDKALGSYLDTLKGSNQADENAQRAGIAARRQYLDTLDKPGGYQSGNNASAALFNRNASANLADLGVAQDSASRASQVALERLKFEQGKLPQPGEAFSLSPGQQRYDAQGNLIAKADPLPPSVTEQYGSGAIGEYNFAKANGYTGSFIQYQNEDANRKAKAVSAASSSGLSTTQQVNAIKNMLVTGVTPGGQQIGNPKGPDGYVDPYVYLAAYQNWPGTVSDFKSKFPISNVNPASYNLLPEALRPKTTSSSSRSI